MSDFITDTFTDADGTLVTAHTPELGGAITMITGTAFAINGGKCYATASGDKFAQYAVSEPGSPVYNQASISVTRLSVLAQSIGVFIHGTDGVVTNLSAYFDSSGNVVTVRWVGGGSVGEGTSVPFTWLAGETHVLKVAFTDYNGGNGEYIYRMYIDGVEVANSGTQGTLPTPAKVGFFMLGAAGSTTTGFHINSLNASDISATLMAGALSPVTTTDSVISLAWAVPSGGSGSFTYAVHRSTSRAFTPGPGNLLDDGLTDRTYDDATPTPGTRYYYQIVVDDGVDTAGSNEMVGKTGKSTLVMGFIGDSTFGTGGGSVTIAPPTYLGQEYAKIDPRRQVVIVNQQHNGARAKSDATYGFQPGDASGFFDDAVAAFTTAGVDVIHICLGTNDALDERTAVEFTADIGAIVDELATDFSGVPIVVHYPNGSDPAFAPGDTNALQDEYEPAIDALVNGDVHAGDTQMRELMLQDTSRWLYDHTHLADNTVSLEWAKAMIGPTFAALNGGGSVTVTVQASIV